MSGETFTSESLGFDFDLVTDEHSEEECSNKNCSAQACWRVLHDHSIACQPNDTLCTGHADMWRRAGIPYSGLCFSCDRLMTITDIVPLR